MGQKKVYQTLEELIFLPHTLLDHIEEQKISNFRRDTFLPLTLLGHIDFQPNIGKLA